MTISDLLKEIIDSSKERVKTPISGAYVLSFALWNWRPFALLLFENTTITQKIIVINSEYCNFWAIAGPFVLCVFFTVGIPYIMTSIDFLLGPAKRKRLKTIYKAKTNELTEQLEIVVKELELQDKKNRSKTTEDFEKQISGLQNTLNTLKTSNKTIVDDYETKLQDLNTVIKSINLEREKEKEINSFRILMINSEFNPADFQFVRNTELTTNEVYGTSLIEPKVYSYLIAQNYIEKFKNGFRITKEGIPFLQFVKQTIENNERNLIFSSEKK
jgi:hypothetical protein